MAETDTKVKTNKLTTAKTKNPARVEAGKLLGQSSAAARERNIRQRHLLELKDAGLLVDGIVPTNAAPSKGSYGSLSYILGGVGALAVLGVGGYAAWKYKTTEKQIPTRVMIFEDKPAPEPLANMLPTPTPAPKETLSSKPLTMSDLLKMRGC